LLNVFQFSLLIFLRSKHK